MRQLSFRLLKVPGHPHHEQIRVALIDDIVSKKRFTMYRQKGTRAPWICCDNFKPFFVLIEWKAFPYCLDELQVIIQIEGVVKHSVVLKKEDAVGATVSLMVGRPGCQKSRPFHMPAEAPFPAESTLEHTETANEATGMISVDICTSGNEKLGTFLFQRQSEEFLQSKGINASRLTKKERKAQNRLKELMKSRDLIDDQIKAAEEHLVRLKEEKPARRRGNRPTETGTSTSDDQVCSGAPGVDSDQVCTGSNEGGQDVQDPEVATDIAMDDAECEEDVKMDDGLDHQQSSTGATGAPV